MSTNSENLQTNQVDRIKAAGMRLQGHARTIDVIGGTWQGMYLVGASYVARCSCSWRGAQWGGRTEAVRDHGDHKAEVLRQEKPSGGVRLRQLTDGWEVCRGSLVVGWVMKYGSLGSETWRAYIATEQAPGGQYIRAGCLTTRKDAVAALVATWQQHAE